MTSAKKIYPGLDFFKILAALMVVIAHAQVGSEFGKIGSYIHVVVPIWVVPFFFCCSGFFLAKQLEKSRWPARTIKRLIVFYVIWTIIYLPLSYQHLDMKLFLTYFFLDGSYYHLWYIPALIISIILVSAIRNEKVALALSLVTLIISVLGSGYYAIGVKIPFLNTIIENDLLFDRLRRVLGIGFPFTALGYYVAKNINKIEIKVKDRTIQFLILTITLLVAELIMIYYFELERDVYNTLFLFPMITAIFLRGLYLPIKCTEKIKKRAYTARVLANCIYFTHPWIIVLVRKTFLLPYPTLVGIATFIISAGIGYAIIKIDNPKLSMLIQ